MSRPHFDFTAVDALIAEGIEEHENAAAEIEEEDVWEPFESNLKQSELRAAARSTDFDTLMSVGTIMSGKTYGIAAIISELCLEYPETLVLVVRYNRKDLQDATIPDFMSVTPEDEVAKFNLSALNMYFKNGSKIFFRPSLERADKLFRWLKGFKPDIVLVDECDGNSRDFISMVMSRVGVPRRRTSRDIPICPPKTFLTCNPNNSWPMDYRNKFIHSPDSLRADRWYFQVVTMEDNKKYINQAKLEQLKKTMTPAMFKRFCEGSWEAMNEKEQLYTFEYMDQCQELIPPDLDDAGNVRPWKYYLGVDPAFYGDDKCPFFIHHGPNLFRVDWFDKCSEPEIIDKILMLMAEFEITMDHVTIDVGGGYGAGVAQQLAKLGIHINEFNGARAVEDEYELYTFTFLNQRARAHWEFMMALRDKKVGGLGKLGYKNDVHVSEVLRQDLAAIHYGFSSGTKAIKIEDKAEIKKRLGRSPDFSDGEILCWLSYLADVKKLSMQMIF